MIASHFAGGKSSTGATCCMPALLTRMSTGPARRHHRLDPGGRGQVAGGVSRAELAAQPVDLLGRAEAVEHHLGALGRERPGDGEADARGRAGDERALACAGTFSTPCDCLASNPKRAGPPRSSAFFARAQRHGGAMRLNPFNPGSINVRRGGGGGFPGGGGGKLGCGAIVIALIGALVFGIDPGQMLGTMEGVQQGAPQQQRAGRRERRRDLRRQRLRDRGVQRAGLAQPDLGAAVPAGRHRVPQPDAVRSTRGGTDSGLRLGDQRGRARSTARPTRASTSTPASTTRWTASSAPAAISRATT